MQLSLQTQNGNPSGPIAFFKAWTMPSSQQIPGDLGVGVSRGLPQEALV